MAETSVTALLATRILEDVALIEEMLELLPEGKEEWRPPDWPASPEEPFTVARLRSHLAESLAGVCGCLYRLHPDALAHLDDLRRRCSAGVPFAELRLAAAGAFALVFDAELTRSLPTVFAPVGVPFLETLLINWKHLLHHAYQLFVYLKLLGVAVTTRHLYRFRE